MKIICMQQLKGAAQFYQSVERMVELNPTIKCFVPQGASSKEVDATVEWINSEIAENGVASIHTNDSKEFCGIQFDNTIQYVVSYVEVK